VPLPGQPAPYAGHYAHDPRPAVGAGVGTLGRRAAVVLGWLALGGSLGRLPRPGDVPDALGWLRLAAGGGQQHRQQRDHCVLADGAH